MSDLLNKKNKKTIIFSGGGTGGSVTPLLAIAKDLAKQDTALIFDFLFIGTKKGIEKSLVDNCLVENRVFRFQGIPAGKFRRYFSWKNFTDIFQIFYAFLISYRILIKEKPRLIVSAGGFVSVPLVWAAYLKKIPIIIHQQDVRPGLANRLMAPFARLITVTFEKSLHDYGAKAAWIGNPVVKIDKTNFEVEEIRKRYQLLPNKPLILITGGGTGSLAINRLAFASNLQLTSQAQVIHLTGYNKLPSSAEKSQLEKNSNYKILEFVDNFELLSLLFLADVVVTRCGLATLTELCALSKAAILIPMPNSHQEDNAAIFAKQKAALVLNQLELNADVFSQEILKLLNNQEQQKDFKNNIKKIMKTDANERLLNFILEILG